MVRTSTSQITKSVDTSDLPALTGGTYTIKHVYLTVLCYFLGQSGAFFGCFFGIRGPDGEWPHAWWAFALLANAFIQTYSYTYSYTAKIVRHPDAFEYFNLWGRTICRVEIGNYESVGLKNGWCSNVVIVRTDEYVQCLKRKCRWCSCCVCKYSSYAVREIDQFAIDHGLADAKQAESIV